jgi:dTDP-4-amino-4,6-dideoxygalactose transaminase
VKVDKVPFHVPAISGQDVDAVASTLSSGWLTTGRVASSFEEEFARTVGAREAVAVNSCTAALHLALAAIGVGEGDEVILPTMTFAATAEVVVHLGAEPVLVDVCPDTLLIDPDAVAEAISPRTRAIIPVHYGGQAADMGKLKEIAAGAGVRIVQDAAHAFPTEYSGKNVGAIGDVACFSFYATKTITTAEGGMITSEDPDLTDVMRSLSLHGLSADAWNRFAPDAPWDYKIVRAGYKYNMPDIVAALGLSQLTRAFKLRDQRREIAEQYEARFRDVPEIVPLAVSDVGAHSWHLYVVRLQVSRIGMSRNNVINHLSSEGIGTSVHYRPLHMHPYYADRFGGPEAFPAAAAAFDEIVSLPIFPDMTHQMVDRVASVLVEIATRHRK